jgi:non-specific serine/threonine protein kinase
MGETGSGSSATTPFQGEPLTPFTGRETELDRLGSLLVECELVCVHGPVGIGKTRLCREAAARHRADFPDGVGYAAMEGLRSERRIVSAMAHSAGLAFYSDSGKLDQLLSYIDGRRMLLFCDSVEDCPELESLLDSLVPVLGDTVLVCARRSPLEHPDTANLALSGVSCRGSEGEAGDGAGLLKAAFTALHGRAPEGITERGMEGLCQRLAGNPMALELAAAMLGQLPPEKLEQELAERLSARAGSTGPPSHRFLVRAMLEVLWSHISREERSAVRQMSVFSGVFPVRHAEMLTEAGQGIFRSLHELGVVRPAGDGEAIMPGPVRDYAFERLSELKQRLVNTRDRHCDIYMGFLEEQAESMRGGRSRQAFAEISRHRTDVRKAWLWALESGRTEMVARGIEGLTGFYEAGSLFSQGVVTFENAAEMLRRLHTLDEGISIEELLAMAQARLGWFLFHTGNMERAEEILSRSLFILRHYGNMRETALTLNYLGAVYQYTGRAREASVHYEEALRLAMSAGDTDGKARALNNLGIASAVQGDFGRAENHMRKFLEISGDTGNRVNYAKALGNLGLIHLQTNRYAEALEIFEEHLRLNRELGAPLGMANSYHHLASAHEMLGKHEEALRLAREALEIREDIGDRRRAVVTRSMMAQSLLSIGRPEEAWEISERAMDEAAEAGYWMEYLGTLGIGAVAAGRAGGSGRAREMLTEGVETALEKGTRPMLLNLLGVAASILWDTEPKRAVLMARIVMQQSEVRGDTRRSLENLLERAGTELEADAMDEISRRAAEEGLTGAIREMRSLAPTPEP